MIEPVKIIDQNQDQYLKRLEMNTSRGVLSIVSIADIHFGANRVPPNQEYEILSNQFTEKIKDLPIDIIAICGDLFDRKFTTDSDVILYTNRFINDLAQLCIIKDITLIIVKGTDGHECGQLKLFYHYMNIPNLDIRIVEQIKFEYVKGAKILCIPELYKEKESLYQYYLYQNQEYDLCLMHGTIEGSVRGNHVGEGRLFTMNDFGFCRGPILAGHIHPGGCYQSHFYYNGSPIRYTFDEKEDNTKGFLVTLLDLDTYRYYIHLEPIESFKYVTLQLDDMPWDDPKRIIDYVNQVKEERGIDYIRIAITRDINKETLELVQKYFRTNPFVKFKIDKLEKIEEAKRLSDEETYKKYEYLFGNMSEYDKLATFMNNDLGYVYITGNEIKEILEEEIC